MFYTDNAPAAIYCQMPKFLFKRGLSATAIILYALMKDRTQLSMQNGWKDETGAYYFLYTIRHMAEDTGLAPRTIQRALDELTKAALLHRVRQGYNNANRLYLLLPDDVTDLTYTTRQNDTSVMPDRRDHSAKMTSPVTPNWPPNKNKYNKNNNKNYVSKEKTDSSWMKAYMGEAETDWETLRDSYQSSPKNSWMSEYM